MSTVSTATQSAPAQQAAKTEAPKKQEAASTEAKSPAPDKFGPAVQVDLSKEAQSHLAANNTAKQQENQPPAQPGA